VEPACREGVKDLEKSPAVMVNFHGRDRRADVSPDNLDAHYRTSAAVSQSPISA
jgi:hypothetical protein